MESINTIVELSACGCGDEDGVGENDDVPVSVGETVAVIDIDGVLELVTVSVPLKLADCDGVALTVADAVCVTDIVFVAVGLAPSDSVAVGVAVGDTVVLADCVGERLLVSVPELDGDVVYVGDTDGVDAAENVELGDAPAVSDDVGVAV